MSHPGRSTARAGSLAVSSTLAGAAAPALAAHTVDRSSVTIPAGSILHLAPAQTPATAPAAVASGGTPDVPPPASSDLRFELLAPAQFTREITRDELRTATGEHSPSPVDLAKGFNVRLWGTAGLLLAILALGLALRSHMKAAAIAGGGALVVPLVGAFVSSTAGLVIAGVTVAAAVALFAAWHFMRTSGKLASTVA